MVRVIVVNKFYYNRGGDCIASIALEDLLRSKGHEVAFFSMQHPDNFPSEWEDYFPSYVDFHDKGIKQKLKALVRLFHSFEVEKRFLALLNDFQPDVVHLNNIHSQLSPMIGEIAHHRGVKVVWTMHDQKLICPSYSCLRDGKPCELCFEDKKNVVKYRCMQKSFPVSLIAYFEAMFWNRKRLIQNTDSFIVPSDFMRQLMIKGGFPSEKIILLPNFSNRSFPNELYTKSDYYCFIGRLSTIKGIQTLITAAERLPYKLVVVGAGPLADQFNNSFNVEFVGFKDWGEISSIVGKARFMVIPSECYENNPLSVIESLSLGTPVLGAHIGGIPELINETNGMLFEAGNVEDLREKIGQMFTRTFNYTDICKMAREQYSAANYYTKLIEIYEQ